MKKYKKRPIDFKLYMITDGSKFTKRQFEIILTKSVHSGVKAIQLREKNLSARALLTLAKNVKMICRKRQTCLLINDRVDIAMAIGADGVQLTTRSLPTVQSRGIIGEKFLLGASTHTLEEVNSAEEGGIDFVLFGPVFETESKKEYGRPQGLKRLEEISRKSKVPVFAVGGINSENARSCVDSGAHGVAVISAIMKSPDIFKTLENFRKSLGTL